MQTCFQLPAVLTTPTNRASPSEVPAAPARSDQRALDSAWQALLLAGGTMTVVDYVVVGVGARTVGRQHPERVGLVTARPAYVLPSAV